MHERLLLLHNENAQGLSHILRLLAGIQEPHVVEYDHIGTMLAAVGFINVAITPDGQGGMKFKDEDFAYLVMERSSACLDLFGANHNPSNVTFVATIQQGVLFPGGEITDLQLIKPQERARRCTLI
jgi:hypothetical protein